MTFIVAVAGKGGVGKSTISALLVQILAGRVDGPVLAVDADPNSNLGEKLGVKADLTIGSLREDIMKRSDEVSSGTSKPEAVLYQVRLAVIEGKDFDLITMGRSEGKGCYCYINGLLRTFLDAEMEKYPYIVIDNEAGMEHLSRRTCSRMDVLVVVSDPTVIGLRTAGRILELAKEMDIDVVSNVLVINRVIGEIPDTIRAMSISLGFDRIVRVPNDRTIESSAIEGGPVDISSLPESTIRSIRNIIE